MAHAVIAEGGGAITRDTDIAVVGMACRFPGAASCDAFWRLLAEGRQAVGPVPPERWAAAGRGRVPPPDGAGAHAGLIEGVERFDHRFFGISRREARALDPQQRLLLEEAWHCLEDAAVAPALLRAARSGVFVGAMTSDHLQAASAEPPDGYAALGAYHGLLANRLSHCLGLSGESLAVDAAHAASFVALHQAVRALRAGALDYALVGGVNLILDPWKAASFARARMLSPDGRCKTFDAGADGYVPAEGAAVLLLEPLAAARRAGRRIHGVIKASAVNHSGATDSLTRPSEAAQRAVILAACAEAGFGPEALGYVEAHGTGTPLGDAAEVAALRRVFAGRDEAAPCLIGSVKTNIGHLEPASGLAGLIKVLLMLRHRQVPASLNLATPNPALGLDEGPLRVTTRLQPWRASGRGRPLRAGVSCFGIGGVNAHVLVEAPPARRRPRRRPPEAPLPFLLSAASEPALAALRAAWRDFAEDPAFEAADLLDLCATLALGRAPLRHRFALLVEDKAQLRRLLRDGAAPALPAGHPAARWLEGAEVPPDELLPVPAFRPLDLPLYPFEPTEIPRVGAAGTPEPAAEAAAAGDDLAARTAAEIRRLLAEILECSAEAIGEQARFVEELGLESFAALELLERLEPLAGRLPPTLPFERSSVAALTGWLLERRGATLAEALGAAAAPAAPAPTASPAEPRSGSAGPDDIAVIGLAGRFPGAGDPEALWRLLVEGRSAIGPVPAARWDAAARVDESGQDPDRAYTRWGGFLDEADCFDALFFNIAPKQAAQMDPQQRIFLETVWACLEDAALTPERLPRRTGVFAGASTNTYGLLAAEAAGAAAGGGVETPDCDLSDIANRASWFLDLEGPSLTVDTACSASLTALHLAVQSLAAGDCEAAFVGGVNLTLHPSRILQFCRKEMLRRGPDCHPFGAGEGGFVDGEGVCVVLLKPLAHALAEGDRVLGVVKATAVNSGGRTSGYTVPSPEAQARMLRRALERAGVEPRSLSYLEAHGTGTALGDPIEIEGLARAFARTPGDGPPCAIGSLKANIGHLIAGAGLAGLAKLLLQFRHETLAPSLNAETLNPHIDFAATPFRVQRRAEPWRRPLIGGREAPLRAGVSAFGSGGSNAHAILEEPPPRSAEGAEPAGPFLLPLSARTPERLRALAERLRGFLAEARGEGRAPRLADVAHTLQVGRVALAARVAFVAADIETLLAALDAWLAGAAPTLDAASPLGAAALAWSAGEAVDWTALPGFGGRRIGLPSYPFERRRHWLALSPIAPAARQADESRVTRLLRPVWRIAPPASAPAAGAGGPILAVVPAEVPAPASAGGLILVRPGAAFAQEAEGAWRLRVEAEADWGRLLDVLGEQGRRPAAILDLSARTGWPALGEAPEAALAPLFALLRALIRRDEPRLPELLVAWPGWVGCGDPRFAPAEALLRAAAREEPRLSWRGLEWDAQAGPLSGDTLLELARRELGQAAPRAVVRHGLGQRWLRAYEPLGEIAAPAVAHRRGGVYLISGGLGGLGLRFAAHLAGQGPCRLALLGRRPPTAEARAAIERLEASGAEVLVVQVDLAEPGGAEAAVAAVRERFGAIHGVVHAAGVKRDGLLAETGWPEALESLRGKGRGAVALDAATRGEPLDFFALFSSIATLLHGDGLTAYAAANGFLEAFADWRELQREAGVRRGRTVSIAWPLWAEGGMAIPEAAVRRLARESGLAPLPAAEGLAAWERVLASGASRAVVLHGEAARLERLLEAPEPARAEPAAAAAPDPVEAGGDLATRCRALLRRLAAEITGAPAAEIEESRPLALYGLDSLGMRQLLQRLEPALGPLSKSLLLEFPSVAALADHLAAAHGERLAALLGGQAPGALSGSRPAAAPTPLRRAPAEPEPIAVVGFSGRFAGAAEVDSYWDNLRAGRDATGPVPAGRWDAEALHDPDPARSAEGRIYCRRGGFLEGVEDFDPLLFELTPLEARQMHPEERLLLESAWSTFESAGYGREALSGGRIGVFVGANALTYPLLGLEAWRRDGNVLLDGSFHGLANRVSYFFDLSGPSLAIDTACSSSLVAVHQACESLRAGACEAALAAGVNLYLHPSKYWLLCRQRLATTKPAFRLFDRDGDGTAPGEGVGSLLLKPLGRALAEGDEIHGLIRASGVAYKGRSNGYLAPAPQAQAALFREVLAGAGLDAGSIGYLELQSAGAAMADSAEWQALAEVYGEGEEPCALGSMKPNVGHLEAATGVAQLIKALLQLRHGEVPPALAAPERNPDVRLEGTRFRLPEAPLAWPAGAGPRRAAITGTAAGGTTAHLVLEEFGGPRRAPTPPARGGRELALLSARTEAGLHAQARALREHLAAGRHGEATLADLCHTLQQGRTPLGRRLAVVAGDLPGLAAGLERFLEDGRGEGVFVGPREGAAAAEEGGSERLYDAADAAGAAGLWVEGHAIDWQRLTGRARNEGRVAWLPTRVFERRRCWLYEGDGVMTTQPEPGRDAGAAEPPAEALAASARPDPGQYVAGYYDRMTDSLRAQTLAVEDEIYVLFAPLAERVPGFSWLKAFFAPDEGRRHLDLMLAKQKELKRALYRHVDFARVRSVFDIGCGLATDLISLARAHPQLSGQGFTITPKQAEAGAERIARAGLADRLAVHCADSTKRPFPGRFDLIIGFEVIFHIADKRAVFANIAEHLDEDGWLILADGVTNTVTEVEMPHLGQFTATAPQFARLLAEAGLVVEDCVDASREISNFLYDADFEANLAAINARYPALAEVEEEHRCWDSFGKVLGRGLVRYLLFTIRKDREARPAEALARLNERRIAQATPYAALGAGAAAPAGPPASAPAPAAAPLAAADPAEVEGGLRALAAEVWELEAESLDPTARFRDYGVGSLQGLLLLEAANRRFGLQLKMPVLYDHSSLRDLARHVASLAAPAPAAADAPPPPAVPAPEPLRARAPVAAPAAAPAAAEEAVAVVGLAGRFAGAEDVAAFWRNLVAGVDSVTPLAPARQGAVPGRYWAGQIEGPELFDPGFFRISPREAELMDPQQRLFLEACWTALEDAGWPLERLEGRRCGVFAGVMGSDYQSLLERAGAAPEAQLLLGTDDSILAARVAYLLDLKGPALTLKTACSSSLVAVHLACRSLLGGEADLALAGGVTLYLDGRPFAMMEQAGMLSPGGRSRPFDEGADGIAVGDGCGVVVLKRLSEALRDGDRVYGLIRGSGMNQDGRTNGLTAPSREAQTALELAVLAASGVEADSIGYVEAHGTGTALGDPIEVAALTEAFRASTARRGFCALGSVKGNIGHTTAAAGVAGLIKALLALERGLIPPSLHFERANRHLELEDGPFFVAAEPRAWPREPGRPRRAAVSAFGYGGTNCHLILEEAPAEPARDEPAPGPQVVPLSARDPERLADYARRLRDAVAGAAGTTLRLPEIAWTLQSGRAAQAERLAVIAASRTGLVEALESFLAGRPDRRLLRGRAGDEPAAAAPLPADLGPEALAAAWVAGRAVGWRGLHGARPPRRVTLPTYPFARERHWLPGAAAAAEPAAPAARTAPATAELACFRPVWRAAPDGAAPPEAGAVATLRPEAADDLAALLAAPGGPPSCVVLRGGELPNLCRVARALLAAELPPLRLIRLEVGSEPSPEAVAAAAFGRALGRETGRLACRSLCVDEEAAVPAALAAAQTEPAPELRWRGGRLERRLLEPLALPQQAAPAFRTGGVYLIAGGAGGLGLALAELLVRRFGAKLLLCGRSEPGGERRRRLEALGEAVVFRHADITQAGAAEALVAEAKARFGALHGVVQAAGLLDDGRLAGKSDARIAAVLAPKLAGTRALDRATAEEPLELFLLFSSLAAAAGNAGQSDYAAANGFLDGFAEWRERERTAGRRSGRSLSIAWPLWVEGGMAVSDQQAAELERTLGLRPLPSQAGLEALLALAGGAGGPRAVVFNGDRDAFLRALEAPGQAAGPAPAAAPEDLRETAARWLTGFFAEQLRLPPEQVGRRTRFEAFGIDSIMINAFNARMSAEIGPFPRTLLFDHQTIEELAGYFAAHHAERLAARVARPVPPVAAPPASRPAAEPVASMTAPPARAAEAPAARHDIAIVGLAGRYPGAPELESFWRNLEAGRDCIGGLPLERWRGAEVGDEVYCRAGGFLEGVEDFDPQFFGIAPREAERMDPQERLFLETAWHALEDAAYPPGRLAALRRERGDEVGVFVGVTGSTYALWGPELWRRGETAIPEALPWSIANRVSFLFDLHGPSLPVDTACSASLSAVHLACESLRRGDCDLALAGGVNLYLHPAKYAQLCQLRMLSAGGRCRSFGAGADGFVPGEGVGALLLKPLEAALADGDRIHAVIKGSAVNHGGRTNGYSVPSPRSQAELIRAALADAEVAAETISCVEAHGTGTALGDPVEVAGLSEAFAGHPGGCALGSVKSAIGHLESAAGIAGLTKLVLQLRHRRLAPTLHAGEVNPAIDLAAGPFALQREAADWPAPEGGPRRAAISSFGAGGANAHVILEEAPPAGAEPAAEGPQLFLLSARDAGRLAALAGRLRRWLEAVPDGERPSAAALAFTLAVGREPLAERLALVADDLDSFCAALAAVEAGEAVGRRGRVREAAEAEAPEAARLLAARDLEGLAALWVAGAAIDWRGLWPQARPRPVSLPGYPFLARRCWILDAPEAEPAAEPVATAPAPAGDPLAELLGALERGEIALEAAQEAFRQLEGAPAAADGGRPLRNGHDHG